MYHLGPYFFVGLFERSKSTLDYKVYRDYYYTLLEIYSCLWFIVELVSSNNTYLTRLTTLFDCNDTEDGHLLSVLIKSFCLQVRFPCFKFSPFRLFDIDLLSQRHHLLPLMKSLFRVTVSVWLSCFLIAFWPSSSHDFLKYDSAVFV